MVENSMLSQALRSQRRRSAAVRKDWDANLHPRGWHGRWVEEAGRRTLHLFEHSGRYIGRYNRRWTDPYLRGEGIPAMAGHAADGFRSALHEADAHQAHSDIFRASDDVAREVRNERLAEAHDDDITTHRSNTNARRLMDEMGMRGVPRARPEPEPGIRTDRARLGIHTDDDGLTQAQRDYRDTLGPRVHVSAQNPLGIGFVRMTTPDGVTRHVNPGGEPARTDEPGDAVDWGY